MRFLTFIFLFAFCQAEETRRQWPPDEFSHVVAYCYDFSQEKRGASIIFPDGSINRGVIRATTIRLNQRQGRELRDLLSTTSKHAHGATDCYEPHHAFVFYDKTWNAVASIEICFFCDDYTGRPDGFSQSIDLIALEKFCRKIGLPMFEKSQDYTKLFHQENKNKDEKPPESDGSDPFED